MTAELGRWEDTQLLLDTLGVVCREGDGQNTLEAFRAEDFWLRDVEFAILLLRQVLSRYGETAELRHWGDTQLWLDTLGVVCQCLSVGGERVASWGVVAL